MRRFVDHDFFKMVCWISNGLTVGDVVTVPDLSPTAHVADCVVSLHVGVDLLGVYPGLMYNLYVPPLDVIKSDLFIVRASCPKPVYFDGTAIVLLLTTS